MKNKAMRILTLSFFVFCLVFNLQAQIIDGSARSEKVVKKNQSVDKVAKMEKRMHRLADKVEMDEDQRARFVPAQIEYIEQMRDLRHSKIDREERKTQMRDLKTEHRNYLSSFLSDEQMTKMREMKKKKRQKRMYKKNKKGKKMKMKMKKRQNELSEM